ncbi:MAG: hypothetical protein JNL11_08160 [Bdellovibrionaceae bacterium]|nr:hypothetical protein [Pseudobdellovibrionaceae bacterium]
MMAISRSDRAQETSRLADLKDEYENRETSNLKKKNAEIKRNQKKHTDELKETSANYENKINDMQKKFHERLTDRDRDHQKQIEDVRGVYASQLRKKMEDSQSERARLTETYESEREHQSKSTGSQKNLMSRRFNEAMSEKSEQIDNLHQKSRAELQETLEARTKKLRAAQEKEKMYLTNSAEDERLKAYNERDKLRRFYENEVSTQKKDNKRDNEDWSNKYSMTVQTLNSQYGDELAVRDELLQQEVNRTRERFDKKYNDLEQRLVGGNDKFREGIDERYNNQVRVKDSEIHRLKNRMYVDQINQKKKDGIEKQHIVDDYEKKIGIYEGNMEEQRGVFKDINDKRIEKINTTHSNILQEKNLRNRVEQSLANEKHRQDRSAIQEQNRNELFNSKNAAEKRIGTIQRLAHESEGRIVSYYDEYLDAMKDGYLEKVFEQREKHDKDLNNLTGIMGEKFRKLKQTYEQRLDRTTRGFEEKIAKLNDEHAKEMKSVSKQNEAVMSEKNKAIVNTRNEVEDKYENKIKDLQDQYKAQVDRMNDRHQEDLRAMAVKMQNYSRKA